MKTVFHQGFASSKIRNVVACSLVGLSVALAPLTSSAQTFWTNTGSGSWDDSGNWSPGIPDGSSTVMIANGGTAVVGSGVSAVYDSLILGPEDDQVGHVEISDGTLAGGFTFLGSGANSQGSLTLNGGSFSSMFTFLGFGPGLGSATVSSGTFSTSDTLYIGYAGSGAFTLQGGEVSTSNVSIGELSGSQGSAVVTSGTWINTAAFTVGVSGTGSLEISGGLVQTGTAYLGDSSASITLSGNGGGRGVLSVESVLKNSGQDSQLVFDGGILRANLDNSDFLAGFDEGDALIEAGGAFVDSNGYSVGIASTLVGTGTLTKLGSGTLTLSGSSSYSGGSNVDAGTLAVANNHALGSGDVTVQGGGTLSILTGFTATNKVILEGGTLTQGFLSGDSLEGALKATSHFDGGTPDTSSSILAGTISADATVSAAFSPVSLASNDADRRSDVLTLSGLPEDDIFVLELSMTDVEPGSFLGWLNGSNEWVNAALVNTGFGSFEDFRDNIPGFVLGDYVGAWGFTDTSVWAVLNHGGDFAIVVPEPSAMLLVLVGAGGMLVRRRRR